MSGAQLVASVRPLFRYELRSALSVRSTHVLVGVALVTALATAMATTSVWAGPGMRLRLPIETVVYAPMGVLAVMLQILGAMRTGHEYRHRHGMLLHVQVPRRMYSYAVKVAFTVAFGGALALAVLALGIGLLWLGGEAGSTLTHQAAATWFELAGRALLAATFYGLAGLAFATVTRSLMGGVLVPLALSSVVEPAVVLLLADRASWLSQALPFSAARHVLGLGAGAPAEPGVQILVVLAWTAALVGAGALRHLRTDR